MLSIWSGSKFCHVGMGLPFPKYALVLMCLQYKSLENAVEMEKLLVTSNFSFSHSGFYPFGKHSGILIKFKIVICELFQFRKV